MLDINEACIKYGDKIIFSDFNLHLAQGDMACIIGTSGCGKSSLLNAIMGLTPLHKGSIYIKKIKLSRSTIGEIRSHVAWIPQELSLPVEWVKDMILVPFQLKANKHISFSEQQLFTYFEKLGLEKDLYFQRTHEISGGQRQRIMLATSVLLQKEIIILDEPTSALDEESTKNVVRFLREQAVNGTTILAVSHDKHFAEGCNKIIEM